MNEAILLELLKRQASKDQERVLGQIANFIAPINERLDNLRAENNNIRQRLTAHDQLFLKILKGLAEDEEA